MLPAHLGLVSMTPAVSLAEVATASAAIQKQLTRDFGPIWTIEATIDPFATIDDVPLGYWKVLIVDTFSDGGQHRDRNNQPYALVAAGNSWPLLASHEAMEMLVDPFGNRVVAGDSPMAGQGRVEFLVEVCDPCQGDEFAYTVNGVLVSDFCTPNYFDPVRADGVRYSFSGTRKRPTRGSAGWISDVARTDWRRMVSAELFCRCSSIQEPWPDCRNQCESPRDDRPKDAGNAPALSACDRAKIDTARFRQVSSGSPGFSCSGSVVPHRRNP